VCTLQFFVLMCRAIGLCTRLVYSLQPVSFKPTDLVGIFAVYTLFCLPSGLVQVMINVI